MDSFREHTIERNKKNAEKQYFIDRRGKIHKYKGPMDKEIVSMHYEISSTIFKTTYPCDVLMKLGWVMIGSSCYHTPIIHKRPTQAQINKLDSLGLYDRLCFLHDKHYVNYEKYQLLCSR